MTTVNEQKRSGTTSLSRMGVGVPPIRGRGATELGSAVPAQGDRERCGAQTDETPQTVWGQRSLSSRPATAFELACAATTLDACGTRHVQTRSWCHNESARETINQAEAPHGLDHRGRRRSE
jgi:hypothetical protein